MTQVTNGKLILKKKLGLNGINRKVIIKCELHKTHKLILHRAVTVTCALVHSETIIAVNKVTTIVTLLEDVARKPAGVSVKRYYNPHRSVLTTGCTISSSRNNATGCCINLLKITVNQNTLLENG